MDYQQTRRVRLFFGFTLLELLVVFSLIVIVASFAFPYFGQLLQGSYAEAGRAQLLHTIQLARSEALIRGQPISLCKSSNQITCGGDWQQGQIVFVDEQQNGIIQRREQILSVFQATMNNATLYWRAFPRHQDYLQFLPDGTTQAENGSFWYCSSRAVHPAWAVMVSKSGRAREVYPNAVGLIVDGRGVPLRC